MASNVWRTSTREQGEDDGLWMTGSLTSALAQVQSDAAFLQIVKYLERPMNTALFRRSAYLDQ